MLLRMVFSWNDTVYALVEHAHLHFCFQNHLYFVKKFPAAKNSFMGEVLLHLLKTVMNTKNEYNFRKS